MVAENLLSNDLIPLRTSDTGDDALSIMSDFHVKHLPIVNNTQLLGLLSEDDILNNDISEPVGSYSLSMPHANVRDNDHVYEIMRMLAEYELTVIPVIDFEKNYIGMVTQGDLLKYFANTGSFTEPGSIIVLEMGKRDYSLSEIARLIESENAAILSSFITTHLHSTKVDVTLKINRQNIQSIVATLNRFEYDIKASFNETEYLDSLKDRYDALMTYLNV